MTSSTPTTEYVLGTDHAEFVRLGLQHRLWSDLALDTWRRCGARPGAVALDVGCGPGHATTDLAQIVGVGGRPGRVVGVDESPGFIETCRSLAAARGLTNVRASVGDVQRLDELALDEGPFDLAYARWVLCFVKDPSAVARGVARRLRPGGFLGVNDYFDYETMALAPRRPAFERVIRAVGASWRASGGDPDIVGRLPRILHDAGLELVHLAVDQRVCQPGQTMWAWPDTFWANYVPRLLQQGHITRGEHDAFFDEWRAASSDPRAFMMLPAVFQVIARKPG